GQRADARAAPAPCPGPVAALVCAGPPGGEGGAPAANHGCERGSDRRGGRLPGRRDAPDAAAPQDRARGARNPAVGGGEPSVAGPSCAGPGRRSWHMPFALRMLGAAIPGCARRRSDMKTFSIKESLRVGWKAFTAHLPVFLTFGVAMIAIWLVGQLGFFIA